MENQPPPEMANDGFVCGPVGIRVLLVEEDPSEVAALTPILQRHGYQVTAMASPEEGLRALRENPEGFDLVMTMVHTQGPGIDGFELLKHANDRYPVILFSGDEPRETVMRALLGGACDILSKPLGDLEIKSIWTHVLRRQVNAASDAAAAANSDDAPISNVVARQDDTARKRGSAALDDSDEGDSHASQQQKQARTTKGTVFDSSAQLHASVVRAAEQLRGTEDYGPRGILDLLVAQGVEVTADQVASHMEKHRRDCLTNHLPAMPMASSSHSNNTRNYITPGILGFHMGSQGTTDVNQTSLLRNGAPPGYYYGNAVNGSMLSASMPSNVAPVQRAMPEGYGNGHGVLVQNGSMVGASVPSNLAQQVHQEMPTNSSFPCSMIRTMDNPNPIGDQEFPRISRLRYHGESGGILMLPWPVPVDDGEDLPVPVNDGEDLSVPVNDGEDLPVPVDDGEDLLRSYLEGDNELMNNTATTQVQGDGADGQISASQPEDFIDLLGWESTDGNGTADTSGGSGVVADGIVDCEFSPDEMMNFF